MVNYYLVLGYNDLKSCGQKRNIKTQLLANIVNFYAKEDSDDQRNFYLPGRGEI